VFLGAAARVLAALQVIGTQRGCIFAILHDEDGKCRDIVTFTFLFHTESGECIQWAMSTATNILQCDMPWGGTTKSSPLFGVIEVCL
jgi:hypothetical protein